MASYNFKTLIGHSGCFLELFENSEGSWIVKKTSGEIVYNERLKKQMLKQKLFKSISRGIFSPPIFKSYYTNSGLFVFEMQMIEGQSISQYILNTDIPALNLLLDRLLDGFDISHSVDGNSNTIFQYKIKQLEDKITWKNKTIETAFVKLRSFNFNGVHKSYCHGDLTLENIIISNEGEIYYIDFLDSFYNSWMIDAAKILQDIELGWCYRYKISDANNDVRLSFVTRKFINKLLHLNDGQNIVKSIYYILLLNLLRIYPYAKDNTTLSFLEDSTQKTINKLNELDKIK